MGVMANKAAGRNTRFAANRCGWRNQRGEGPASCKDCGYLSMSGLIVSGSCKSLPAIRQCVVECFSYREPPQALVRPRCLVYEDKTFNAQRQRNVGYAARMAAEAENHQPERQRRHL